MKLGKSAAFAVVAGALAPASFAQKDDATERKDYACGGGKLVVWTTQDYEEQHVVVWLEDRDGKPVHPGLTAPGTFVPWCDKGVFLLLDTTWSQFEPGPSWIMSVSGDVLSRFELTNLVDYGFTEDRALVWTQSIDHKPNVSGNEQNAWSTRLRVFTSRGVVVHDAVYDAATRKTLTHEGRSYTFDVEKPDFPY